MEVVLLKRIIASILLILLLISIGLPAMGSIGLGTRAMSMGGAFTAVADDESAFYWNPAGITQVRFASLMFGAGAQGEEFDFITDTIDKISNEEELDPDNFENGRGYMNLGLIGGVTTRFVGVNFYSESSFSANKDNNSLEVDLFSLNYGTLTVAFNIGEKISVGSNIKKIVAGKGESNVIPDTDVPENSISDTCYADGDGMAYDLGVLYRLSDQVKFGFVARNVTGEIDWETGERVDYTTDPKTTTKDYTPSEKLPKDYSVGVSYRPFKNTLLAFDVQKCDYRPPFTPEQTRFRIGFEQTALWNIFALRLGAFTNKDEPLAMTAGLGFKLGPLAIGVAGVREEFNSKEAVEALVTAGIRF